MYLFVGICKWCSGCNVEDNIGVCNDIKFIYIGDYEWWVVIIIFYNDLYIMDYCVDGEVIMVGNDIDGDIEFFLLVGCILN